MGHALSGVLWTKELAMNRGWMWRAALRVGVGAAGVLLSCVVGAESFVPIVPHTGMTLGSALNVL